MAIVRSRKSAGKPKSPSQLRTSPDSKVLRIDPTRTITLRRRLAAELKRRFNRLRLKIYRLVAEEDVFGLGPVARDPFAEVPTQSLTVANTRWQFQPNPDKVRSFRSWLREQLKADVLTPDDDLWERYVREGYMKGAGRAFDDTNRALGRSALPNSLVANPTNLPGVNPTMGEEFYRGGRQQFLRDSFARPVAPEKVKQLTGRAFDELEGVTLQMELRMTGVLTDGLAQGKSPREVARDLAKVTDLGRDRALTIAQTETIRAHAEGQLDALENLGVTEVGAAVEWSDTGDEKVCKLCKPLDGVVLSIREARGLIPRHPRCRCSWTPAEVGEKMGDLLRKETKARIDAAIRESVELQAGRGRDRVAALEKVSWPGVDLKVSKRRPKGVLNEDYNSRLSGETYPELLEFSRLVSKYS